MKSKGFTLIELLVVLLVISLGFILLLNLRTKYYLTETVNLVVADIRDTQFKAVSSLKYQNTHRCGYGITDNIANHSEYYIYTGVNASTSNCSSVDRSYALGVQGQQLIPPTPKRLFSSKFEFKKVASGFNWCGFIGNCDFFDIFFEPPNPQVFICNNFLPVIFPCNDTYDDLTDPPGRIQIGRVGQACSATTCKTICVYTSGRVEVVNGTAACP